MLKIIGRKVGNEIILEKEGDPITERWIFYRIETDLFNGDAKPRGMAEIGSP